MPFQPGQSGNPQGRKRDDSLVRELARQHTEKAIEALVKALGNERTSVAAASALLDRGYGKPAQEITGPDGGALIEAINIHLVRPEGKQPKEEPSYTIGGDSPLEIKFR
jgi:hypothetical protein